MPRINPDETLSIDLEFKADDEQRHRAQILLTLASSDIKKFDLLAFRIYINTWGHKDNPFTSSEEYFAPTIHLTKHDARKLARTLLQFAFSPEHPYA